MKQWVFTWILLIIIIHGKMSNRFCFFIFFLLLSLLGCNSKKEKVLVGIQPFENFDKDLCDSLKAAMETYYGFSVHILPSIQLPSSAFINIKSPRYRADSLISYLRKVKSDSVDYIMGLTNKDISVPKLDEDGNVKQPAWKYNDFGIFGLGFRPGVSCVVSTFRLNASHHEFLSRLKKVALHELGHNLGLEHCDANKCFMRSAAEKIQTVDQVKLELCESCKRKI